MVLFSAVNTANDIYNMHQTAKIKPMNGVVQTIKIILIVFCVLLIISFLMGKKVSTMRYRGPRASLCCGAKLSKCGLIQVQEKLDKFIDSDQNAAEKHCSSASEATTAVVGRQMVRSHWKGRLPLGKSTFFLAVRS